MRRLGFASGVSAAAGENRGALAAAPAGPRLGATKEESKPGRSLSGSSGFADLISGERVLDVGEDALLGGAWQLADSLENLPCPTRRARAAFGGDLFAE